MNDNKHIWLHHEGDGQMARVLGSKGANIVEANRLKLPVPPGFTIAAGCSKTGVDFRGAIKSCVMDEVRAAVALLDHKAGRTFGDVRNPHLLAIRTGAATESGTRLMPAVLNAGMNDEIADSLVDLTGNPRFVYDAYSRLIASLGIASHTSPLARLRLIDFQRDREEVQSARGAEQMTADDFKGLCAIYKARIRAEAGCEFPQNVFVQLQLAIEAAFASGRGNLPVVIQRQDRIDDSAEVAVTVQSMVFGNMSGDSGAGVGIVQAPATVDTEFHGCFVPRVQQIDVSNFDSAIPLGDIARDDAKLNEQLRRVARILSRSATQSCLFEFIVERGKLSVLRTRPSDLKVPSAILAEYRSRLYAKQGGEITMSLGDKRRVPHEERLGVAA